MGAVAGAGSESLGVIVQGLGRTVQFIERITGDVDRQAAAMDALRSDVARIRQIAGATLERARRSAAAAEDQGHAMQNLAETSQRTAGSAATLEALAGRFRLVEASEPSVAAAPAVAAEQGTGAPREQPDRPPVLARAAG